jgi:hypothetical protein
MFRSLLHVDHFPKAIINLHQGVSSYKKLSAISTMAYHLTETISYLHYDVSFSKSYHQSPSGCIILQKAIINLHYGVSPYKNQCAVSTMVYPLIKLDPSCKLPSMNISPAVRTFGIINEPSWFFSSHKHYSLARQHSVSQNKVFPILRSPPQHTPLVPVSTFSLIYNAFPLPSVLP